MDDFLKRYEKLNENQRKAVDNIDGPLLVIAGPGSGKTELLSVRIANILDKTDTLPSSILCLTFTDSAAKNMLQRLSKIIGPSAYQVGIHTFHSFGNELISRYPEYFFDGQEMKVADDVVSVEILDKIFHDLPFNTPLKIHHAGGHFSDFKAAKDIISKLKTAGLSPEDFKRFLDSNNEFLEQTRAFIHDFWANINLRKKDSINEVSKFIDYLHSISESQTSVNPIFKSLKTHLLDDLLEAHNEATESSKTSPITKWKNRYLEKDDQNTFILKDYKRMAKNVAFAHVYKQYQLTLETRGFMDYDDMLIRVVKALKDNADLRFSLQEKYLYFLIDEFQDTNGVQMEIVDLLSDSEVNEGNPNLFVVGDDDQSIFKFQGANIANILKFKDKYPQADLIVLSANYRSNQAVISLVRETILQGTDRLENHLPEITKELICGNPNIESGAIEINGSTTEEQEFSWIIEKTKALTAQGLKPENIALISRKHSGLIKAASYFEAAGIAVNYENRKNVLHQKHIIQLIKTLQFLNYLSKQNHQEAGHLLSEILTFDFWQISRLEIWRISFEAYEKRLPWLEIMLKSPQEKIRNIANFLITVSTYTQDLTAEQIIDLVVGNRGLNISDTLEENIFASPYKSFYFSKRGASAEGREEQASLTVTDVDCDYLELLSNLSFLIKKIRRLTNATPLYLHDLVEVINLHEKYSLPINDPGHLFSHQGGINLITSHKAKGLEFDTVFVFDCEEEVWSDKAGDKFNMLPSNLPIFPERDNQDDVLRLFYVALSRAQRNLFLSYHTQDESGRAMSPLRFINQQEAEQSADNLTHVESDEHSTFIKVLEAKTFNIKSPLITENEHQFLKGKVQNYQLSVTHLNDFIDLIHCGPDQFFEKNILRFPIMPSLELSYGNAIHKAIDRFYKVFKKVKMLPTLSNFLTFYKDALNMQRLNAHDFAKLLAKGEDKLTNYYNFHKQSFNPEDKSEISFGFGGFTVVDGVPIKGKIDRMQINEQTGEIKVFDYKTGKPLRDFDGYHSNEKVKALKYKNQLIFYKLLIENSRNYKGKYTVTTGTLEFIDEANEPKSLSYEITQEDTDNLRVLMKTVYARIKALNFKSPDLSDPDFADVMEFIAQLSQQ